MTATLLGNFSFGSGGSVAAAAAVVRHVFHSGCFVFFLVVDDSRNHVHQYLTCFCHDFVMLKIQLSYQMFGYLVCCFVFVSPGAFFVDPVPWCTWADSVNFFLVTGTKMTTFVFFWIAEYFKRSISS